MTVTKRTHASNAQRHNAQWHTNARERRTAEIRLRMMLLIHMDSESGDW